MFVSAQLARNSGLRVRVNRKIATIAADNNDQGDVQATEFGIPGYYDLVWNVFLVCDRISSSTQHGLNVKLQLGDYLNARARSKIRRYRRGYAVENIAFAPAILSETVAGKMHPEFLRLLWVMADMHTPGLWINSQIFGPNFFHWASGELDNCKLGVFQSHCFLLLLLRFIFNKLSQIKTYIYIQPPESSRLLSLMKRTGTTSSTFSLECAGNRAG